MEILILSQESLLPSELLIPLALSQTQGARSILTVVCSIRVSRESRTQMHKTSVFLHSYSIKFSDYINNRKGSTAYTCLEWIDTNSKEYRELSFLECTLYTLSTDELRFGARNHGSKWTCEIYDGTKLTFFYFSLLELSYVSETERADSRMCSWFISHGM